MDVRRMKGRTFVPVVAFEARVNGRINRYVVGQKYTIYWTHEHDDLAAKAPIWEREGKIVFTGAVSRGSRPATVKETRIK